MALLAVLLQDGSDVSGESHCRRRGGVGLLGQQRLAACVEEKDGYRAQAGTAEATTDARNGHVKTPLREGYTKRALSERRN